MMRTWGRQQQAHHQPFPKSHLSHRISSNSLSMMSLADQMSLHSNAHWLAGTCCWTVQLLRAMLMYKYQASKHIGTGRLAALLICTACCCPMDMPAGKHARPVRQSPANAARLSLCMSALAAPFWPCIAFHWSANGHHPATLKLLGSSPGLKQNQCLISFFEINASCDEEHAAAAEHLQPHAASQLVAASWVCGFQEALHQMHAKVDIIDYSCHVRHMSAQRWHVLIF